jgi:transketolase
MRNAFADEITELAAIDKRVVLLSGDIGNKLFDNFKKIDKNRFYNCGVAEANMMGVAAGMALSGLRPIIYTITPFTTTRCFEQIRVDVCYHRAPVIIVGTGSGLSYAELGPTHHSLEDMAILRTLPGMCVLAPCDVFELRAALRVALQQDRPVYILIGKKG